MGGEGVCLLSLYVRSGAGQQRGTLNAVIAGFGWHLQLLIINMMVARYQWWEDVEEKERWDLTESSNRQSGLSVDFQRHWD